MKYKILSGFNCRLSLNVILSITMVFICFLQAYAGAHLKDINPPNDYIIGTLVTKKDHKINGIVTDKNEKPLIGVTVKIKNSSRGTVTDNSGKFSLEVSNKDILIVSYIGYQTQEIIIGNNDYITVKLTPVSSRLNQVVVVGYGTEKKVDLTGSVSSIGGKALTDRPATSPGALLEGHLPGVFINQPSGIPGQTPSILIRGVGTMNNTTPLVIVDGLESSMSDINPEDIASISVLKDASAAAIYGAAAANGVILVTTKRGSLGKPKVSYNAYFGKQQATRLPHNLNSYQYATLINEADKNVGIDTTYTQAEIEKYKNGSDPYNYPNTNWLGLLLQGSGFTQDHSLSFSGGSSAAKYRLSLEYYDQLGLMERTYHKRYNVRFNENSKISNWLSISLSTGLSRNVVSSPTSPFGGGSGLSEFFRQANMIPPNIPNKTKDGGWNYWSNGNPIAWMENGGSDTYYETHALGSVSGIITLMKGLTLKGVAGIDFNTSLEHYHVKEITYFDGFTQGPNSVSENYNRYQNIILQGLLNYQKSIGKHNIKLLLGVERQSSSSQGLGAFRKDFPSNDISQLDAGSTDGWSNSGSEDQDKLGSYFGRLNYNYEGKYLLEANVRRDGSSRFAPEKRWGVFPSVSAGWRISQEGFLKSVSWLDNLKLRASWGQLGNDNIAYYQYISTITLGQNYPFGGVENDGAATTVADNPDITWETTTELDIGLDADLFHNGLLSITADYYNKLTNNILTSIPVSAIFGLGAPIVNGGAMRNRGIEVILSHKNSLGAFTYGISVNASYNKNVVTKYATPSKGSTIRQVGIAWNSFYGYKWIGYFASDAEAQKLPHQPGLPVMAGDLRYKDLNGDGVINADDRTVLGNTIPEFIYGFNLNLGYKNFDFSLFCQGVMGNYKMIGNDLSWPFTEGGNGVVAALDRIIVQNGQVIKYGHMPVTRPNGEQNLNNVMSSFLVHNASYLRLKNVQLGYTFPLSWLKREGISHIRVYLSGENLLTITKFPRAADPEATNGDMSYDYPQVMFYTAGFNINF